MKNADAKQTHKQARKPKARVYFQLEYKTKNQGFWLPMNNLLFGDEGLAAENVATMRPEAWPGFTFRVTKITETREVVRTSLKPGKKAKR
jgi:hypothetical protein